MNTPAFWIAVIIATDLLFGIGYALASDGKTAFPKPTASDMATNWFSSAMALPIRGLFVWLVWNHVVVHEFSVPTIGYLSATFIAWAAHAATAKTSRD